MNILSKTFYDNSIPGLELIISILFLMPKHKPNII